MFARIATTALFAGFITGIIAAVLQFWQVQPMLLHAELYEGGDLIHFGADPVSAHQDLPGFEAVRDGLSILFTTLIYTGYAFILTAVVALFADRGHSFTLGQGVLFGLAGFTAIQLAPAMGLPPEVPGAGAAALEARQFWWVITAIATAVGLGLIGFSKNIVYLVAGAVLVALPHVIGAPEPDVFAGPTPPELAAHFASRALGVGMAAWAILGALTVFFWNREG